MQIIYAGLRNGARDQAIHDALIYKRVAEVAEEFRLSPNTVRAAAKRIANAQSFELVLLGGGVVLSALARWLLIRSARRHSVRIGTSVGRSRTWSCPAG